MRLGEQANFMAVWGVRAVRSVVWESFQAPTSPAEVTRQSAPTLVLHLLGHFFLVSFFSVPLVHPLNIAFATAAKSLAKLDPEKMLSRIDETPAHLRCQCRCLLLGPCPRCGTSRCSSMPCLFTATLGCRLLSLQPLAAPLESMCHAWVPSRANAHDDRPHTCRKSHVTSI